MKKLIADILVLGLIIIGFSISTWYQTSKQPDTLQINRNRPISTLNETG